MTNQDPRWYSVNNMGMATLCAGQDDAEDVASTCDIAFPRQAPHIAAQLVEVSELDKLHAEIARLTAANEALLAKRRLSITFFRTTFTTDSRRAWLILPTPLLLLADAIRHTTGSMTQSQWSWSSWKKSKNI